MNIESAGATSNNKNVHVSICVKENGTDVKRTLLKDHELREAPN